MKQFIQMNCNNEWNDDKQLEMELATATASILPENCEDNTVHLNNTSIFCTLNFSIFREMVL